MLVGIYQVRVFLSEGDDTFQGVVFVTLQGTVTRLLHNLPQRKPRSFTRRRV